MKKKYSLYTIKKAKEILELPSYVDLKHIKEKYKKLVKKYHPDKNKSKEAKEKIIMINKAYEIIMDYIKHYKYSFDEESILHYNPSAKDEVKDWHWGKDTK